MPNSLPAAEILSAAAQCLQRYLHPYIPCNVGKPERHENGDMACMVGDALIIACEQPGPIGVEVCFRRTHGRRCWERRLHLSRRELANDEIDFIKLRIYDVIEDFVRGAYAFEMAPYAMQSPSGWDQPALSTPLEDLKRFAAGARAEYAQRYCTLDDIKAALDSKPTGSGSADPFAPVLEECSAMIDAATANAQQCVGGMISFIDGITTLYPAAFLSHVTVRKGETVCLMPGHYGNVVVEGGGKLTAKQPGVLIDDLLLHHGASLIDPGRLVTVAEPSGIEVGGSCPDSDSDPVPVQFEVGPVITLPPDYQHEWPSPAPSPFENPEDDIDQPTIQERKAPRA